MAHFLAPPPLTGRVLPGVLPLFAHSHPAVEVEVNVGRSVDLVAKLDLTLINAGNDGLDDSRGEVIYSEELVWAGRDGGLAMQRSPLVGAGQPRLCLAPDGARRAGPPGRGLPLAYSCEQCADQKAAMTANLAIAPFPRSLVKPPLRRLGAEQGLPPLGDYHIKLIRSHQPNDAIEALAALMTQAFAQS